MAIQLSASVFLFLVMPQLEGSRIDLCSIASQALVSHDLGHIELHCCCGVLALLELLGFRGRGLAL